MQAQRLQSRTLISETSEYVWTFQIFFKQGQDWDGSRQHNKKFERTGDNIFLEDDDRISDAGGDYQSNDEHTTDGATGDDAVDIDTGDNFRGSSRTKLAALAERTMDGRLTSKQVMMPQALMLPIYTGGNIGEGG